jgi:hypothetical protein
MKIKNPLKKLTLIKKTIASLKCEHPVDVPGGIFNEFLNMFKTSCKIKKLSGIRLHLKIEKRKKNLEITIDITLIAKAALLFFLIIQMSC